MIIKGEVIMNKFRESRLKKGYTQDDLAKIIGVDRSTISRWENGDTLPRLHRLIFISELLEVDMNVLIGYGCKN